MEQKLKEMNANYMKRTINEEEGAPIDQLFFNNPDGFMVELCNCKNLELVPAGRQFYGAYEAATRPSQSPTQGSNTKRSRMFIVANA